jgi:hypothetical protein
MTYKNMFVAEIKVNGKILRVKDDTVYLPFGSEYSIYLKNLNTRRAAVNVHVDGQDALDNSSLILNPNEVTELKGFLRGSVARNRFKFIKKTEKIQEHRGDKIDDGFVRIEFSFEKDKPEIIKQTIIHEHHYHEYPVWRRFHWNYDNFFTGNSNDTYGVVGSSLKGMSDDVQQTTYMSNVTCDSLGVADGVSESSNKINVPLEDEGITVKGSEICQDFHYTSIGELDQAEVIILKLKGITETKQNISKPITVKTKLKCSSCGTASPSSAKYCPECGTFLE